MHDCDQPCVGQVHLLSSCHPGAQHSQRTAANRQLSTPGGMSIAACTNSSIFQDASSFDCADCTESLQQPAARSDHHTLLLLPPQQQHGNICPVLKSAEQAVSMRLLPLLLLLVMVSYIDRTNLSFASIQLSRDLRLSSTIYGLGSGAFFLAYACGQIPSNFLLLKYGGPTWLAAITVAWGIAASAFALVRGPISFVLLRLVLGLAESGAIPGVWYYVSLFYPANKTTLPYSLIETGITVSQVIAAPIAALLLMLDGVGGLQGWQWLFLLEGLPALLLGCVIRFWLPKSIETANFMSQSQKDALSKAITAAKEAATATAAAAPDHGNSLRHSSSDELQVCLKDDSSITNSSNNRSLGQLQQPGCCQVAQKDSSSGTSDASISVRHATAAAAALAPAGDCNTERQLLLDDGTVRSTGVHSTLQATASEAAVPAAAVSSVSNSAGAGQHTISSSSGSSRRQALLSVLKNRVVLYAGCWRILHDIPGNGVLYWTPKIVQALLVAAGATAAAASGRTDLSSSMVIGTGTTGSNSNVTDSSLGTGSSFNTTSWHVQKAAAAAGPGAASPGVYVVLLSAIPYAAASLFHLLNAWHSQRSNERRWHIAITWVGGALALLLLPLAAGGALAATTVGEADQGTGPAIVSTASSIAAFTVLTLAHVGVNGANGIQTGLVSGCILSSEKALGLALYNTIGNVGSFWGPLLIGLLHDATGGYAVALWVLGGSLAGGACMVARFSPQHLDSRLRQHTAVSC